MRYNLGDVVLGDEEGSAAAGGRQYRTLLWVHLMMLALLQGATSSIVLRKSRVHSSYQPTKPVGL